MADAKQEGRNRVEVPVPAYDAMSESWELIEALKGGTRSMRDGRDKWLPQEPAEDGALYEVRLRRSYLYEAYGDTVKKLVAKPFSRPVQLINDAPEQLVDIEEDVDGNGKNLTQFGREVFTAGIDYGLTHILVDMPQVNEALNAAGVQTLEDQNLRRPVFIHVPPTALIGWQPAPDQTHGLGRLSQIRILEVRDEPAGLYGVESVKYIRVYTEQNWQLWRAGEEDDDYSMWAEGSHTFGAVPLITYYVNQTGILQGVPALEDLAWLNLAHYQSLSDQRNLLRIARVPVLFAKGLSQKEYDAGIVVGANQLIRSTSKDAALMYVEHSGRALGAGSQDLKELEERMMILGLDPLIRQPGGMTATGTAISEAKTHTAIQAWIRSLENSFRKAYEMAGLWIGQELDDEFKVDINNDFGISLGDAGQLDTLIKARQQKQISHETFLMELRRRGVLQETLDIAEEIERVGEEEPAMADIGLNEDERQQRDQGIEDEEEEEEEINENETPATQEAA